MNGRKGISLSVIITTYNKPNYLSLALSGFDCQTNKDFEIIIADDGSDEQTRKVIEEFKGKSDIAVSHVWHEDKGFRKCRILNKAILVSQSDYLLFIDDDCIPRNDFIAVHLKHAKKGFFLSGGYFKLNDVLTNQVTKEHVLQQKLFDKRWLKKRGQGATYKYLKLTKRKWLAWLMNLVTTAKPTWNGHNVSGWKDDIVSVNGYNEAMQYGGLDRELGERLVNKGIQGVQIRYSAICVHLNHPRPYRDKELMKKNRQIREDVKREKRTYAALGIDQHTD